MILYEMVIGRAPFLSNTPGETQRKILEWKENFYIPSSANISKEAESLIRGLITDEEQRLGKNGGAAEIKKHPFFKGKEQQI